MLHLIFGCMYSGKTTKLLEKYKYFKKHKAKCILITPLSRVKTHDGEELESKTVRNLLMADIDNYDAIFIDEAQFYKDIMPFSYICRKKRKALIMCGLNGDFKGRIFGEMVNLIPHATKVTYLTAKCICGKVAMYSKRLSDNDELVAVNDVYEPVCELHR